MIKRWWYSWRCEDGDIHSFFPTARRFLCFTRWRCIKCNKKDWL